MKKLAVASVLILIVALVAFSAQLTLKGAGRPVSLATGTYANSQIDTVTYTVEGSVTAYRFYIHPADSVSVTNIIVRRIFDSRLLSVQAGDTIIGALASISADTLLTGAAPATPLCEQLKFLVKYAASANGVTTPTVTYGLVKQY